MTITLTPYSVARAQPWNHNSKGIDICGLLLVQDSNLRIVDPEYNDYRIDIVDKQFSNSDTLSQWPLAPFAECLMVVDIEWILSTVRISKIHKLQVRCPWERKYNYKTIWISEEMTKYNI